MHALFLTDEHVLHASGISLYYSTTICLGLKRQLDIFNLLMLRA